MGPDPAISLAGLRLPEKAPRTRIEWVKAVGGRAVQLDGAAAGLRPRELDRSARRDLAALLRRLDLGFAGLDLWIPPPHFSEGAHVDRAVAALVDATGFAAEIAGLTGASAVVCVELPEALHPDAARALGAGQACPVADFGPRGGVGHGAGVIPGYDPAPALLAGRDASAELAGLTRPAARLADADAGARCVVGRGRLKAGEYAIACAAAGVRSLVLDLRGLDDADGAARAGLEAWRRAGALGGGGA